MANEELAWLAGLLEGEGSFFMAGGKNAKNGKTYMYPRVVLAMTDLDVVARAAKLMGDCTVFHVQPSQRNRKMIYRAQALGAQGVAVMRSIRPYMGERRAAKIDTLLAEYDSKEPTAARRSRACATATGSRCRAADGTFRKKDLADFIREG